MVVISLALKTMFLGHVATLSGSLLQVFIIFFDFNRPWLGPSGPQMTGTRLFDFPDSNLWRRKTNWSAFIRLLLFPKQKKSAWTKDGQAFCQYVIDPYYKLPLTWVHTPTNKWNYHFGFEPDQIKAPFLYCSLLGGVSKKISVFACLSKKL